MIASISSAHVDAVARSPGYTAFIRVRRLISIDTRGDLRRASGVHCRSACGPAQSARRDGHSREAPSTASLEACGPGGARRGGLRPGPTRARRCVALAREDAEARVRRAAVTRLDDVAVLGDIARTDPDEDVRAEAIRGLAGLAAETDDVTAAAEVVRQLLALGRSQEVVVVARESAQPRRARRRWSISSTIRSRSAPSAVMRQDGATRLRALARLTDADEILNVALKSEHTDAAVAALERVERCRRRSPRSRSAPATRWPRGARGRELRQIEEAAQPPPKSRSRMSREIAQRAVDAAARGRSLVAVADPDEADDRAGRRAAGVGRAAGRRRGRRPPSTQQFDAASEAVREAIAERQRERAAEEERAQALAREQADRVAIVQRDRSSSAGRGAAIASPS